MSDTKTAGQELQGEILKTVRKSQETVVDAIQMWTDAVQAIKPPLPEVSIPSVSYTHLTLPTKA